MVEETRAIESTVHYEVVADMGSGLLIAKVKLADIREQDINARIMKTEMQKQLTDNIKKRGQLGQRAAAKTEANNARNTAAS